MTQLRKSGTGPIQILLKWYDSGNLEMGLFRFYLSGTILASHFRFARTQPEMAQVRKSGNGPVQILLKWYDSGNPFPFSQTPTLNGPVKEIWKWPSSDFT
jgi:hypothetical protein